MIIFNNNKHNSGQMKNIFIFQKQENSLLKYNKNYKREIMISQKKQKKYNKKTIFNYKKVMN